MATLNELGKSLDALVASHEALQVAAQTMKVGAPLFRQFDFDSASTKEVIDRFPREVIRCDLGAAGAGKGQSISDPLDEGSMFFLPSRAQVNLPPRQHSATRKSHPCSRRTSPFPVAENEFNEDPALQTHSGTSWAERQWFWPSFRERDLSGVSRPIGPEACHVSSPRMGRQTPEGFTFAKQTVELPTHNQFFGSAFR